MSDLDQEDAAPKYRTLAADGATAPFVTRRAAERAAQRIADATQRWCGVQVTDETDAWWLIATAEPTGTRPSETSGLINPADLPSATGN